MTTPPEGWLPHNIMVCPMSSKNAMDDLLYTIVRKWYEANGTPPEGWALIEGRAWTNYNETFRDLLITWLRLLENVSKKNTYPSHNTINQ